MSTVNVEVKLKDGESVEHLIKRFIKKCKKEQVLEEYKEHTFYEKPSRKRRKKEIERQRVLRRARAKEKELAEAEYTTNYKKKKKKVLKDKTWKETI